MNCRTCGKKYSIECDYNQGRCPHHPYINVDWGHIVIAVGILMIVIGCLL
jgi:hypothetical protein